MKRATAILAALLMLCGMAAQAELMLDGTVVCAVTASQSARMGGTVSQVYVMPGDYVHVGDPVASLSLTRVYAPCDGTVEAVFAQAGESADDATSRYGGVMTLLPEARYNIYATSSSAYKSVRTSHVVPGQEVYMKCTKDGSHRGAGVVFETDGNLIFIEATGGTFHNGETVYVYMESDYDSEDQLAKGTVLANIVQNVEAGGDVYKTYVQPGDFVEKGQLLFETLGALPEDGGAEACLLTAEAEGYVTAVAIQAGDTVARDGLMLTYCPAEGLVAAALAPESDVASVAPGEAATLSIDLSEEILRLQGTVAGVSYLPETADDGGTGYRVLISFPPDPRVAPGMSLSATLKD